MKNAIIIYPSCSKDFGGGGQRWTQLSEVFVRSDWRTFFLDPEPRRLPMPPQSIEGNKYLVVARPEPKLVEDIKAYKLAGYKFIFDFIDDWSGLTDGWYDVAAENWMIDNADLILCTTPLLLDKIQERGKAGILVPNAGNPSAFFKADIENTSIKRGRITVGYFGSMWGAWFNHDIVARLAAAHPEWAFNLIGQHCNGEAYRRLFSFANVKFHGIIPHDKLNEFIQPCDICIIPFRNLPISEYTDPVKIYEYALAQKPIVTVAFPSVVDLPFAEVMSTGLPKEETRIACIPFKRSNEIAPWEIAIDRLAGKPCAFPVAPLSWQDRFERITKAFKPSSCAGGLPVAKAPPISVVIPSWNDAPQLVETLKRLSVQTLTPSEILVIDNLSNDNTREVCLEYGARHILVKGNISKARNKGVEDAKSELIAFTDCGCYLRRDWLERLADSWQPGIVAGSVIYEHRTGNARRDELGKIIYACGQSTTAGFGFSGSSLLLSKKDFATVGKFDELMDSGEDTEWNHRLNKTPLKREIIQTRICEHEVLSSDRDVFKVYFKFGKWDKIGCPLRDYSPYWNNLETYDLGSHQGLICVAGAIGWIKGRELQIEDSTEIMSSMIQIPEKIKRWLNMNGLRLVPRERVYIVNSRSTPFKIDEHKDIVELCKEKNATILSIGEVLQNKKWAATQKFDVNSAYKQIGLESSVKLEDFVNINPPDRLYLPFPTDRISKRIAASIHPCDIRKQTVIPKAPAAIWYEKWMNEESFKIWIFQSAGIGDFIELVSSYYDALVGYAGASFADAMLKNTVFVVNEFIKELPMSLDIESFQDFTLALRPKTKAQLAAEFNNKVDWLINLTAASLPLPDGKTISPLSKIGGTSVENLLSRERRPARFRWWTNSIVGHGSYFSDSLYSGIKKGTPRLDIEPGFLLFLPSARDGQGLESPVNGRSIGAPLLKALMRQGKRDKMRMAMASDAQSLYQSIGAAMKECGVIDYVSRGTSLPDLAELIEKAAGIICAESGPAHIAAVLRKPTLVLCDARTVEQMSFNVSCVSRGRLTIPKVLPLRESDPVKCERLAASIFLDLENLMSCK